MYFLLFIKTCLQLVQRMFIRDIRFGFCPENHWLSTIKFASIDRLSSILENNDALLSRIRFGQSSYLFQDGNLLIFYMDDLINFRNSFKNYFKNKFEHILRNRSRI